MGKGDKKSKRGKIVKGTYGNSRPRQATIRKAAEKKEAATSK